MTPPEGAGSAPTPTGERSGSGDAGKSAATDGSSTVEIVSSTSPPWRRRRRPRTPGRVRLRRPTASGVVRHRGGRSGVWAAAARPRGPRTVGRRGAGRSPGVPPRPPSRRPARAGPARSTVSTARRTRAHPPPSGRRAGRRSPRIPVARTSRCAEYSVRLMRAGHGQRPQKPSGHPHPAQQKGSTEHGHGRAERVRKVDRRVRLRGRICQVPPRAGLRIPQQRLGSTGRAVLGGHVGQPAERIEDDQRHDAGRERQGGPRTEQPPPHPAGRPRSSRPIASPAPR